MSVIGKVMELRGAMRQVVGSAAEKVRHTQPTRAGITSTGELDLQLVRAGSDAFASTLRGVVDLSQNAGRRAYWHVMLGEPVLRARGIRPQQVDVLVSGAGPAGTTFATLAKSEAPDAVIRVIDSRGAVGTRWQNLQLKPGSVAAVTDADAGRLFDDAVSAVAGDGWWSVKTHDLEGALRPAAAEAGVEVLYEQPKIAALANRRGGVTALLEGPDGVRQAIRARMLVVAEGSRSSTRALAGIRMQRTPKRAVYAIAKFDAQPAPLSRPNQGGAAEATRTVKHRVATGQWDVAIAHPKSPTLMSELRPGEYLLDDAGRVTLTDAGKAAFAERARRYGIVGEMQGDAPMAFLCDEALSTAGARKSVLLISDSVGVTTPVSGDNLNTGLDDARHAAGMVAQILDDTGIRRGPGRQTIVEEVGSTVRARHRDKLARHTHLYPNAAS